MTRRSAATGSSREGRASVCAQAPGSSPRLFVVDGGKLTVVTVGAGLVPQAGQTLVAIVNVPAVGASASD
ncbi:MAG: hypothetical protein M8861_05130 [marine benthic group bacterium]|nr:hypothetical protein [Gemmatimonadota bacterium]